MGAERKTFRYNATTIFFWNRYSTKSFLDKAVNVWVLYPEPNKKISQLLILRCTLLECLILWWKASTQIQGPISHSVFETLTTQRGSNRFICLMSRYFLLSVGPKLKHSSMSVKLELDVYQCHQTKSKRKNDWWKHQSVGDGTPVWWLHYRITQILSDHALALDTVTIPLPQDCPRDRSSTGHVWVVLAHVRNKFVKI